MFIKPNKNNPQKAKSPSQPSFFPSLHLTPILPPILPLFLPLRLAKPSFHRQTKHYKNHYPSPIPIIAFSITVHFTHFFREKRTVFALQKFPSKKSCFLFLNQQLLVKNQKMFLQNLLGAAKLVLKPQVFSRSFMTAFRPNQAVSTAGTQLVKSNTSILQSSSYAPL